MLRQIGPPELLLILAVLVLLFGAKKLPDLARGSGRALRIFKAETKGLMDEHAESVPAELAAVDPAAPVTVEVMEDSPQREPVV